MNTFEKQLCLKILEQGPLDYPGGKICAYSAGQKIVDIEYGKTWKFYDLASLTKIIFTTSIFMKLVETKALSLKAPIQKFLPWYKYSSKTLRQILSHRGGYIDWLPFYKDIDPGLPLVEKYQWLYRALRQCKPRSTAYSKYSDIDFFLLGAVLEYHFKKPMAKIWREFKESHFSTTQIHFCENNTPVFSRSQYAPTEKCPWRKIHLQGEVHDDNAWTLGGVAPHAGLFGTMEDMQKWVLKIRKIQKGTPDFIGPKTLKVFTKASMPQKYGDWGLGFMKPSLQSTAGSYFSSTSYGHTGFTGTSIWMDPKKDLQIILLSNRVCPTRKNRDFIRLRPQIHNWIVEHLRGQL